MESIVGKILCDRYRIVRELNEDDFSAVYVAEDLDENNDRCYVEQLQPYYDNEVLGNQSWQKVLQTFIEAGTVLKNLSQHPQIPQLVDFFECDRQFYLVREHIQGESLAQKLQRSLITEVEAIKWLQEILGILEFVHQAKITHLNIQPSSLHEYRGKKFLTDFATIKNAISTNSNSSLAVINSDFAAPELKLGKPEYSSDIYALGKTIIYALTGRLDRIGVQLTAKGLNSNKSNSSNNISSQLANVLNKMISQGISDRYQTTTEVLTDLDFSQNVVTFPTPVFNEFSYGSRGNSKPRSISRNRTLLTKRPKFGRKIIWSLSALPFIVALAIVFIGINKNSYRRFDNYVNNEYEFSIKYPQDWLLQELNDPITGTIVVFNSPIEGYSDIFQEKVYITVEDLSTETTNFEQYTQGVLDRIEQSEGSNVKVYDEFETTIDNSPARTVVYSRQENGLGLKQMETFTIRNDRAYIAIYTAEADEFSEFSNTAQKIIDSWQIQ